EVRVAVAVKVSGRHEGRIGANREADAGLKSAVAVAQQNGYRAVRIQMIGNAEVEDAVAIEVGHRHGRRSRAGEVGLGGRKSAVPLAQKNAQASIAAAVGSTDVGHGEIDMTVAVKVPDRHRNGPNADGVVMGYLKRAVAPAQKDP